MWDLGARDEVTEGWAPNLERITSRKNSAVSRLGLFVQITKAQFLKKCWGDQAPTEIKGESIAPCPEEKAVPIFLKAKHKGEKCS